LVDISTYKGPGTELKAVGEVDMRYGDPGDENDAKLGRVFTGEQDAKGFKGNPKDTIGASKTPLSQLPEVAILHGSLGMYEGSLKYGFRNYRKYPVKASVYVDAILRHILDYSDGIDADEKTTVKHLGSVIAGCAILLDAEAHGTLVDDRDKSRIAADEFEKAMSVVARLHELHGTDTRLLEDRDG